MKLSQPYYIEPRRGARHISLDGVWDYAYADEATDEPEKLGWPYSTRVPLAAYWSLYESGILPHPYEGVNSKLYDWPDKKVWYYRRTFRADGFTGAEKALLCFDGVCYHSRVWLNGVLLGEHAGMFGGPVVDVSGYLAVGGENTLTVEVKSANYGKRPGWRSNSEDAEEIIPWNLVRDDQTSNGDFVMLGIWRSVRLELLSPVHISRPYLFTESVADGTAKLHLSCEVVPPEVNELKCCLPESISDTYGYTFAYGKGLNFEPTDLSVELEVELTDGDGKTAYSAVVPYTLYDFAKSGIHPKFEECQFIEHDITLPDARLWNPVGMGSPELYEVRLTLRQKGETLDEQRFDFGVRTVTRDFTSGPRFRGRWDKFKFIVNGEPIFLRGVNWMPLDFLLKSERNEYRWALECARDAGIQLIRVWSGGGMPEDDAFYEYCDKLGIMVWQDNLIANAKTPKWPQDVLRAQVDMNLYRLRNHPSLAVHCGGNEFNPYAYGNAASMFAIECGIHDLDPHREYVRTTPDKGSAHIYRDMEPVWYRLCYKHLPFVGESGIHSFPNFKTLRALVSEDEATRPLDDIFTEKFKQTNPELVNHFTEFIPDRIPRMLSRASHINDIRGITPSDLAEATQLAAYEFYQVMIESTRENWPVTGGIMPWVFKRPWATVAVQLLDGAGDTTASYYAVKHAYSRVTLTLSLTNLSFCAGERIALPVTLLNDSGTDAAGIATLRILDPSLETVYEDVRELSCEAGEYRTGYAAPDFTIPEKYRDTQLYAYLTFTSCGAVTAWNFYRLKVLSVLDDADFCEKYRAEPQPNILLEHGPWARRQWENAPKTALSVVCGETERDGEFVSLTAEVTNSGTVPAYPVKLDIAEFGTLCRAEDSFFILGAGETRRLRVNVRDARAGGGELTLAVTAWNAPETSASINIM